MNRAGKKLSTIIICLLLLGCNAINHKTDSIGKLSKQSILLDSLHNLDSLVLQYRVKNPYKSIEYAKQASKVAYELNTPAARVKAYISIGNAYSVIRIDSGLFFYDQAMMVIDSFNLTDLKGEVLYNMGMLNRSSGNYKNYIMLIDSSLKSSISANDFITISNSLNALGCFYSTIGEKVNARKMFDSAYSIAIRKSLSLQIGSALGNLARFEANNEKSIKLQRRAISYMERCVGSEEPIALCLINIGYSSPDEDSAIYYFDKAINMVSIEFAPEVVIGAYNNMAYCYLEKGDLIKAEKCILDHALPIAVKTNNIDWQSTVYDTYADILKRKGRETDALVYRNKSIEARKTYRASVSSILPGLRNY